MSCQYGTHKPAFASLIRVWAAASAKTVILIYSSFNTLSGSPDETLTIIPMLPWDVVTREAQPFEGPLPAWLGPAGYGTRPAARHATPITAMPLKIELFADSGLFRDIPVGV